MPQALTTEDIAILRLQEFRVRFESYLYGHITALGLAVQLRELYAKTEEIAKVS